MTNWAKSERALLCEDFTRLGPDAATLCGTWSTRQLAAHLVLREQRPDAAAGIVLRAAVARRYTEKVQQRIARRPWPELVDAVRNGPPVWSPTRLGPLDELVNTVEFFVHHEDVRRAQPDWQPRTLEPAHEAVLATALGRMKSLLRSSPVGLELRGPTGTSLLQRPGPGTVVVTGPPSELLLFAYGRQSHTNLGYDGTPADINSARTARFGI